MWTGHAKSCYNSNSKPQANLHIALLDINAEGMLHREIKDIVEELDIMLFITRSQKEVINNYVSQVEGIINPNGEFGARATTRANDGDIQITEFTNSTAATDERKHSEASGTALPEYIMKATVYDPFMERATEMRAKMVACIEELEQLRTSAQATAESVRYPVPGISRN